MWSWSPCGIFGWLSGGLVGALLLLVLEWRSRKWPGTDRAGNERPQAFWYGARSGPGHWRCAYPAARGKSQSPVNVALGQVAPVCPSEPLLWCGYAEEPLAMSLTNDGNSLALSGRWPCPRRPSLRGGPLKGAYEFRTALFRWGPGEHEGSEHSLEHARFPMELQAVHVRQGLSGGWREAAANGGPDCVAVVAYFFALTQADNPYLEHVVQALPRARSPGSEARLPPFPLEWLCPGFARGYFLYRGSLTHPPCSEVALWLLHPEPLALSVDQLRRFRETCSAEGPILSNCRPVQKLNGRRVYHFV